MPRKARIDAPDAVHFKWLVGRVAHLSDMQLDEALKPRRYPRTGHGPQYPFVRGAPRTGPPCDGSGQAVEVIPAIGQPIHQMG